MSGHTWSVGNPYGPICEVCEVALGTEFANTPCPGSEDVDIEQLRARVAELEAESKPRPMDEAPRDGTEVLGCIPYTNGANAGRYYYLVVGWSDQYVAWADCNFSCAWLPLPAVAKDGEV